MFERIFRESAKGAVWALWFTGMWFCWRSAWLAVDVLAPPWFVDPSWYSFMLASTVVTIALYFGVKYLSE